MLKGFREFVMRGNAVELAVGIVIGAAFTALVNSFVNNVISPLLGAVGTKNLNDYYWCIKGPCGVDAKGNVTGVAVGWGALIGAILTFLLTAAVVYFVFVLPMNKLREKFPPKDEQEAEEQIVLLREIRNALTTRTD